MLTLIKNIKELYGIRNASDKFIAGKAMKDLPFLNNAWLLIEDDKIINFGTDNFLNKVDKVIDANNKMVLPCWCDSHTHIVFAGSRENEFIDKINGLTYNEIASKGGGILNSALKLQDAPEQLLLDNALSRLEEMQKFGTGAVEIKSGYGLSYDGELKMLRVIQQLKQQSPLKIKATFLGAHAFPLKYKENRAGYLKLLIEDLLPVIANEGLADFIDVFCDHGFFTVDETAQLLEAGNKYGLRAKIHANELAVSGGVEVGVKYNALSVDHLECMDDHAINSLIGSETMPTLLPTTAFFLNIPFAPARKMIDAGLPIAIATDYNPGSSPSGNMQLAISMSCIKMKMLPEEAINAATINSAYAMGIENEFGSITIGKKANLIITKPIPSLAYIPYAFGSNHVEQVIINGK